MPRRLLYLAVLLIVLIGGGWVVSQMTRPAPAPVATVSNAPAPAARPPAPAPTVAAAPPTAAAPAPRRPSAPKPAPAPEPVPEVSAAPTVGTLFIDSDVQGAQVFIDRNYIGVTPVTANDVAPGSHRLNIVATGYESLAENVDVAPGPRNLQFNFKEIRLDASLDVIHKHRMGSCKGRLVATPQGIRYDTTDKDDAFSIALTDVEQLEVDYLAKVLRVKSKKGKRYEFTDPEGNADRLFVFHRDVDKVRHQVLASK